jgi:hypothetical protein
MHAHYATMIVGYNALRALQHTSVKNLDQLLTVCKGHHIWGNDN